MKRNVIFSPFLVTILLSIVLGCGRKDAPSNVYTLDYQSPFLVYAGSYTNIPDKVNVYVTGPKRSFGIGIGLDELLLMKPRYGTKDIDEIRQLLFDLFQRSLKI